MKKLQFGICSHSICSQCVYVHNDRHRRLPGGPWRKDLTFTN